MKKSNAISPLHYLALLCSLNKDKPTCKETLIGRMEEYYEVFITKRRLRTMLEKLLEKKLIRKDYGCYSWIKPSDPYEILTVLNLRGQDMCFGYEVRIVDSITKAHTPIKGWRRFFNRQKV